MVSRRDPKRDIRRIDLAGADLQRAYLLNADLTFADLSDAPLGPAYLGPAYLPGAQLFLDACAEPEVERSILLDAPAVLGWEAWRDLVGRYGLGLVQLALQSAMDVGAIIPQPRRPLAHVLIGVLDESALYVGRAEDPPTAREECAAIIDRILRSITPDV